MNGLALLSPQGKGVEKKMQHKQNVAYMALFLVVLSAAALFAPATVAETMNTTDDVATSTGVPMLGLSGLHVRHSVVRAELTKQGLLQIAAELGITGRNKMSKDELRAAIDAAQNAPTIADNHTGTGKVERFAESDTIDLPVQRCAEIRGKIVRLNVPGDGPCTIQDEDGKQYQVHASTWTALGQAMERGLNGFYYKVWTPGGGSRAHPEQQRAMLTQANNISMDDRATVKFRVIDTNPDGSRADRLSLYAVLSTDYTEVVAEDLYDEMRQYLSPDLYHYNLRGNDGIHAGRIIVTQRNTDSLGIFNYQCVIDCGKMNGMDSVRVQGGARILACANQLSFDVSKMARDLGITIDVGTGTRGARRHAGDIDGITDWVAETFMGATEMEKFSHAAFATDISSDDFTDILDFYADKRGFSAKLRSALSEAWENDEITQVPETLYGFIMAATYIGTHNDEIKDGVSYKLRTAGGELLAIAPHWNDLFPAIQAGAEARRERLAKEEAARQAAAEKAAAELAAMTGQPLEEE